MLKLFCRTLKNTNNFDFLDFFVVKFTFAIIQSDRVDGACFRFSGSCSSSLGRRNQLIFTFFMITSVTD